MSKSPIIDCVPVTKSDGQVIYAPAAEVSAMRSAELLAPFLRDLSPGRLFAVLGVGTIFWGALHWLSWKMQQEHERRETRKQRRVIRKVAKEIAAIRRRENARPNAPKCWSEYKTKKRR